MKAKDLALIATVITAAFGLMILFGGNPVGSLLWLGYAWAGYFRLQGGETSKRICLSLSIIMLFLHTAMLLSNYTDDRVVDVIAWSVLAFIDYKLIGQKVA